MLILKKYGGFSYLCELCIIHQYYGNKTHAFIANLLLAFLRECVEAVRGDFEEFNSNALPEYDFEIKQLVLVQTGPKCSKC